jgi:hypothetical protein
VECSQHALLLPLLLHSFRHQDAVLPTISGVAMERLDACTPRQYSQHALLLLLLHPFRHQDAVLPTISGVAMERLDAWWASHKEEVTAGLSSFALEVVTPGAIMVSMRTKCIALTATSVSGAGMMLLPAEQLACP